MTFTLAAKTPYQDQLQRVADRCTNSLGALKLLQEKSPSFDEFKYEIEEMASLVKRYQKWIAPLYDKTKLMDLGQHDDQAVRALGLALKESKLLPPHGMAVITELEKMSNQLENINLKSSPEQIEEAKVMLWKIRQGAWNLLPDGGCFG